MPKIVDIEIDLCGAALTQGTLDTLAAKVHAAREEGAQGVNIILRHVTPLMFPRLIADHSDLLHRVAEFIARQNDL